MYLLLKVPYMKDVSSHSYVRPQSRTQSPQALWPVVGLQERLWGTGILLPQDFCGKTMEVIT